MRRIRASRRQRGAKTIIAVALATVCAQATWGQATDGVQVRPWLEIEGEEADASAVTLERTDDGIVARFEAPADGTYRVGIAIAASTITPFAPGLLEYSAGDLPEPLVLRYPYEWTYAGERNVMNLPRLAAPMARAGGEWFAVDTHELWSLRLQASDDGRVEALFLAHRYLNDGADAATSELALKAGETVELRVRIAGGPDAAQALRRHGPRHPVRGTMTQSAYRGWTAVQYGPAQYTNIADALAGHYDQVIVREAGTHDWIPPLFHERGLQVLAYQYLGALRRFSAQVTDDSEAEIGMVGSGGGRYTAPRSPDGPWLLGDIRRPEVRALFVGRAVAAIEAGFDGLFLDGTNFFADDAGRRGGDVPGAEHSLAWAHWMLLSEIRDAVHTADPEAIVGTLGNDYYDALAAADFIVKERMYFGWEPFGRELTGRGTVVSAQYDTAFETGEAPLVATQLVYGVKGFSSIAVQTARHFIRRPTGAFYLGTGDHSPENLDLWLDVIVRHATEDLWVTAIDPPDCALHFEGRDTVRADEDCRIELSRPACVADVEGRCLAHQVTAADLSGETRYRLLHDCARE